jgi:hypothetical protein
MDLDDTITDRAATVRAYVPQFMRDFGDRFGPADPVQVAAELIRIDRSGYNPARALVPRVTPWPDAIAAAAESVESFPELIALLGPCRAQQAEAARHVTSRGGIE